MTPAGKGAQVKRVPRVAIDRDGSLTGWEQKSPVQG